MKLRFIHSIALAAGAFLPVLFTVLVGLARLLSALGDQAGAGVVDRIVLACGVLWVVVLVTLILLNALRYELISPRDAEEFSEPPETP